MEGSSRPLAFFVLSALLWCATTVPLAVFIYVTTAILTTIPGLFTIAARWILILWVLCPFRLHVAHCASSTVLRAYVRFFFGGDESFEDFRLLGTTQVTLHTLFKAGPHCNFFKSS